jgi:hypothetical protein
MPGKMPCPLTSVPRFTYDCMKLKKTCKLDFSPIWGKKVKNAENPAGQQKAKLAMIID